MDTRTQRTIGYNQNTNQFKLFYLRDYKRHVLGLAQTKEQFLHQYINSRPKDDDKRVPLDELKIKKIELELEERIRLAEILKVDWEMPFEELINKPKGFFYDILSKVEDNILFKEWRKERRRPI